MKIKGKTVFSSVIIGDDGVEHYACKDIEGNVYIPHVICKNLDTFDVAYLKVLPFDQLETIELENTVKEDEIDN